MPRRKEAPKRKILPDAKYGNLKVAKFMNQVMSNGKKALAENIVYGAFEEITKKANRDANLISLEHGDPIRFGVDSEFGVVVEGGVAKVVSVADVGESALLVHDEGKADPSTALKLSRLARGPVEPTTIGVFRAIHRIE